MTKRAVGPVIAVALALFASSFARADDPPKAPPAGTKPEEPKKEEPKKDEAKKDQAALRIERAKKLVAEIEKEIARAKAAQPIDQDLLQRLFTMLDDAKALARPVRPEDLTEDEKKAVIDEAQKQAAPDPAKKGGDPTNDWAQRMLARAIEGAELTEDETKKAGTLIGDWWKENLASMGDSKKQSDLKRKRDDDLEKAFGKKKAQKIINNLNSMGPGRR